MVNILKLWRSFVILVTLQNVQSALLTLFQREKPANIYLHKVNNKNTRKGCEICSKLIMKTPERRLWPLSCRKRKVDEKWILLGEMKNNLCHLFFSQFRLDLTIWVFSCSLTFQCHVSCQGDIAYFRLVFHFN